MLKLYVGNLSFNTGEAQLRALFEPHGEVASAAVVMDRDTGRSRGFGYVEMTSDDAGRAAIAAMGGKEADGRALTVNEAKPREARTGGGGSRGGSSGGGTGGRGGW